MSLQPVTEAGLIAKCEAATPVSTLNAEFVKVADGTSGPAYFLRVTTAGGGSNQFFKLMQPFYTADPTTGAANGPD